MSNKIKQLALFASVAALSSVGGFYHWQEIEKRQAVETQLAETREVIRRFNSLGIKPEKWIAYNQAVVMVDVVFGYLYLNGELLEEVDKGDGLRSWEYLTKDGHQVALNLGNALCSVYVEYRGNTYYSPSECPDVRQYLK